MAHKQPFIGVVAGGSGGHLIPGITYGHNACKSNHAKLIVFSTSALLDQEICRSSSNLAYYFPLSISKVPSFFSARVLFFLAQSIYAFFRSGYQLIRFRPLYLISMGGYISLPVCFAAWLLRIPIELVELNAKPGKAIRFLCPLATTLSVCFEQAAGLLNRKTRIIDYPLRFTTTDIIEKKQATGQCGLQEEKPILLILGGSQGSRFINDLVLSFVDAYADKLIGNIQILHQTGHADKERVTRCYKEKNINASVIDFSSQLKYYYSAADLVISRCGAGTLFETLFFGKRAFVIPLERVADAHQQANAQAVYAKHGNVISIFKQSELEQNATIFFKQVCSSLDLTID